MAILSASMAIRRLRRRGTTLRSTDTAIRRRPTVEVGGDRPVNIGRISGSGGISRFRFFCIRRKKSRSGSLRCGIFGIGSATNQSRSSRKITLMWRRGRGPSNSQKYTPCH